MPGAPKRRRDPSPSASLSTTTSAIKRHAPGEPEPSLPRSPTFLPEHTPTEESIDPIHLNRNPVAPQTTRATKVTFGLLSADTILNGSVCAIETPRTHLRGHALANGLLDPRMGPAKAGDVCVTCNREYSQCPGHHAHLTLALPVFNAELITVAVKVLRSVCYHCSRLLLRSPQFENKLAALAQISSKKDRLNAVATASKSVLVCGSTSDRPNLKGRPCGGTQMRFTHVKKDCTVLVQCIEHTDSRSIRACTPFKIQSILRHITDQDVTLLGLSPQHSHPRDMMWSVFYIPPPLIRPGRTDRDQQPNARSENDLTKRLKSIVRCNQLLAKHLTTPPASDAARVHTTPSLHPHERCSLLSAQARHSITTPNLMSKEAPADALSRAYRDLQIAIGSYQNNSGRWSVRQNARFCSKSISGPRRSQEVQNKGHPTVGKRKHGCEGGDCSQCNGRPHHNWRPKVDVHANDLPRAHHHLQSSAPGRNRGQRA